MPGAQLPSSASSLLHGGARSFTPASWVITHRSGGVERGNVGENEMENMEEKGVSLL